MMHLPQLPLPRRRQIRTNLRQLALPEPRLMLHALIKQISQLRRDRRSTAQKGFPIIQSVPETASLRRRVVCCGQRALAACVPVEDAVFAAGGGLRSRFVPGFGVYGCWRGLAVAEDDAGLGLGLGGRLGFEDAAVEVCCYCGGAAAGCYWHFCLSVGLLCCSRICY
jgi:hypothetical protein